MYFLFLGIVLLLLKALAFGPIASWDWWLVLLPFLFAVLWWAWADWSGYTKRAVIQEIKRRNQKRSDKLSKSLGLASKHKK